MPDSIGSTIAAFSFIAFVILIPPLCYHIQNKNVPAISLILWFCINNLVSFVNALIWSNKNFYEASDGKGYCDLTVRVLSGSAVGQLCATACIIFNLYMILAAKSPSYLAPHSKSRLIINLIMCWFNPLLLMGLSVIVQTNRYDITRYRGCTASYDYTLGSVMLVSIWNVVWIAIACTFAVLTIVEFLKKRKDIQDILRCTNSGMNQKKFFRLIILSLLIILVLSPVTLMSFASDVEAVTNATEEIKALYAEVKWSDIYAEDLGTKNLTNTIIEIVFSFCTFLLFGLGTDAIKMYSRFLSWIKVIKLNSEEVKEFYVSKEFGESRQKTKDSEYSETTIGFSREEHQNYEALVLEKGPFAASPDVDEVETLDEVETF